MASVRCTTHCVIRNGRKSYELKILFAVHENENGVRTESRDDVLCVECCYILDINAFYSSLSLSRLLCGCLYECAVCPISFCRIWKIEMHTATTASDGESWKRGTSHSTLSTARTVCHFMPDNSTRSKHHSLSLVAWSTENKIGGKKSIEMNKSPRFFVRDSKFQCKSCSFKCVTISMKQISDLEKYEQMLVSSRFKCKRVAPTAHMTKYSFLTQFRSIFDFSKSVCGAQSTAFGRECWRKNREPRDF